jgi:hypothetical protein
MKTTIDMAREAGFVENAGNVYGDHANLKAFEALVRADAIAGEREACAKECDELAGILVCHNDRDGADICVSLRDTFRARGNT